MNIFLDVDHLYNRPLTSLLLLVRRSVIPRLYGSHLHVFWNRFHFFFNSQFLIFTPKKRYAYLCTYKFESFVISIQNAYFHYLYIHMYVYVCMYMFVYLYSVADGCNVDVRIEPSYCNISVTH